MNEHPDQNRHGHRDETQHAPTPHKPGQQPGREEQHPQQKDEHHWKHEDPDIRGNIDRDGHEDDLAQEPGIGP
jgi:hypothetical protein